MIDFVRTLCITISTALFRLIPTLYSLFHGLAALPSLFETEQIKTITNNIYTITSVVMLFAFATKAISGIVNPDNLWDGKKGVTGVLKRSLIALALIVAIPFGFQYYYEFQTKIISSALIEKFVLGLNFSEENVLTESELTELNEIIEKESNKNKQEELRDAALKNAIGYKIGQSLAQNAFKNVVRPTEGNTCTDKSGVKSILQFAIKTPSYMIPGYGVYKGIKDIFTSGANSLNSGAIITPAGRFLGKDGYLSPCDAYNRAITENIDYSQYLNGVINTTSGFDLLQGVTGQSSGQIDAEHYIFEMDFWGLLAVVVGGVIVYMLVIFCIDSAVRLIKMAFLEITAPVSIMAYIAGGNDMLKKWWNEVLGTVISFFLRVAAISFIALVLINLEDFTKNIPAYYGNFARIFIIIGTLIFAKKVPELVEKLVGVKLNLQGGIGGRLGQMAGVGKVAQNAWKTLGNTAKGVGATAAGFGLGALGVGTKFGAKKFDEKILNGKGQNLLNQFNESNSGRYIKAGASAAKSGISAGGGIKSIKAVSSSWKGNEDVKALKAEANRRDAQKILERYRSNQSQNEVGRNENLLNGNIKDSSGNILKDLKIKTAAAGATEAEKLQIKNTNNAIQQDRIAEAQRASNERTNSILKEGSYSNESAKKGIEYMSAMDTKTILEDAKSKKEKITNILDSIQNRTDNIDAQNLISTIKGDIRNGKLDDSILDANGLNLKNQIQNLLNMNVGMAKDEADRIISGITAYNDYINSSLFTTEANKFGINSNVIADALLSRAITDSDKFVANVKDDYELQKTKDVKLKLMSEESSKVLDSIIADSQITKKEEIAEISKKSKFDNTVINAATTPPSSPTPTGGQGGQPLGGSPSSSTGGSTNGANPQNNNTQQQGQGNNQNVNSQQNNNQNGGLGGQTIKVDNITTNTIDAQNVTAKSFSTNQFKANSFNTDTFSSKNNPVNNQSSSNDSDNTDKNETHEKRVERTLDSIANNTKDTAENTKKDDNK